MWMTRIVYVADTWKGYFLLGYQKLHVSVTCRRAASDDQFNGGGAAFLLFRCRVIKE